MNAHAARVGLQRGNEGAEVRALQDLMNRTGALLVLDGNFGPGTDRALRRCQTLAGAELTGILDERTASWLQQQPEPSDELSCEAVTFIVHEEVSSRAYYDLNAAKPHDPGEDSGVTIGIGYDLQYQAADFERDWGGELDNATRDRFRPYLGRPADAEAIAALLDIEIPFEVAWRVFTRWTLPKYVDRTRDTFGGFDQLPDLCRGALVSLIYNRGTSLDGDRRREMREIRDAIAAGEKSRVPELFESMKRLWTSEGLRKRRDKEADLWRDGLRRGE